MGDAPGQEQSQAPSSDAAPEKPNKQAKDWRKSDKEWQEMKEKANKADQLVSTLQKVFAPADNPVEEQKDPATLAVERVQELERQVAKSQWEADHPVVRDERYAEAWQAINAEPRLKDLTYDEKLKLIMTPDTKNLTNELLSQASKTGGSVLPTSRGTQMQPGIDAATKEMASRWGIPEKQLEKYLLEKKVA